MKADLSLTVEAADYIAPYVHDSTPENVWLSFREKASGGSMVTVRMSRTQFEVIAGRVAKELAERDRMAAARRGEAVPAVVVTDGEAATKLLRELVEAFDHFAGSERTALAFLAGAAFLGFKVTERP